ncbi:MAG: site-specific DNA-methyltransferase [Chloroflexi bacterium]|nr:site-specific DNA-methyltransferase [Chloroflexota bacterium]
MIQDVTEDQLGLPWELAAREAGEKEKRRYKKRANDLDGATWERFSISVWSDIRKSKEESALRHPALFPVQLADRLIQCYSRQEEQVVLDPFAGVGSTIVAAHRLRKTGIGIEPQFVEKARSRFDMVSGDTKSAVHCDDARNLHKYVSPSSADMVITSPPYWDILLEKRTADSKPVRHYGEELADLGKIRDYQGFLGELEKIFGLVFDVLKPGKFCCVIVMDLRKKDKFFFYHSDVARFTQKIGFTLDDVIIWDRRLEYSNMRPLGYPYRFRINKAHEYVLIFQKPATPQP